MKAKKVERTLLKGPGVRFDLNRCMYSEVTEAMDTYKYYSNCGYMVYFANALFGRKHGKSKGTRITQ
jgi:hypothetical protein